ncbi:MAG: choline/ethanolamine kinase family protein [Gammaproteobacteria bacterium]
MSAEVALQALKHIPGWDKLTDVTVRSVGNGNTNTSWVITRDRESFVLRVDSPAAEKLALSRANEIVVRTHVSKAGLAPAVIHSDPKRGILLSEYAAGRAWSQQDILNEQSVLELASILRRLYALPTIGNLFDPERAMRHYAEQLKDSVSLDRADEVSRILKTVGERPSMLCHNDLVAENIIEGEQLWLIDWEYAGVGDPLFDLAVIVEHHGMEKSLAVKLIETTLGSMNRQIANDLAAYREVYRHIVALWSGII